MEFMVFLPGMLLAYFPVKQYLRLRPTKLAALAVPLILLLCLAGEAVRRFFHINILWLFFPASAIMGMPACGLPPKNAVSGCPPGSVREKYALFLSFLY